MVLISVYGGPKLILDYLSPLIDYFICIASSFALLLPLILEDG